MSASRLASSTPIAITRLTACTTGKSRVVIESTAQRPMPGIEKMLSVMTEPPTDQPELQPEHGHDRNQRVLERVAQHHGLLGQPLGAGRRHVVLVEHFQQRRPGLTHQHRRQPQPEREGRHQHPGQVLDRVLGERHEAGRRQPRRTTAKK